jgi:hypothetical protein
LDAIAEILQVGSVLGHDPQTWKPVFGKVRTQNKNERRVRFSEAGSDSSAQPGELGVAIGAVVDSRENAGAFDESFPPGGCHRVADSAGLRANGNTQR